MSPAASPSAGTRVPPTVVPPPPKAPVHKCNECGAEFATPRLLRQHQRQRNHGLNSGDGPKMYEVSPQPKGHSSLVLRVASNKKKKKGKAKRAAIGSGKQVRTIQLQYVLRCQFYLYIINRQKLQRRCRLRPALLRWPWRTHSTSTWPAWRPRRTRRRRRTSRAGRCPRTLGAASAPRSSLGTTPGRATNGNTGKRQRNKRLYGERYVRTCCCSKRKKQLSDMT